MGGDTGTGVDVYEGGETAMCDAGSASCEFGDGTDIAAGVFGARRER